MNEIMAARLKAAEREIAELERRLGPDDLKLSYKLDAYAELLREANQLLDASNIEARARAIRKKQFAQEVISGADKPEKYAYKRSGKLAAQIVVALLFVGVATLLFWGQQSVSKLGKTSDPRNGWQDKTFLFSKDDGFVMHLETKPGEPEQDYSDSGFAMESTPTRAVAVDVAPVEKKGFGPKSTAFLEYYRNHPFSIRMGFRHQLGDLQLAAHEGSYQIRSGFPLTPEDAARFQDGGLWKVFWDGSPPVEPPKN